MKALLAIYAELKHLAGLAYREIKQVIGTVGRRGWRPLIPWIMIFMVGAIAYRIAMGLPLPNVAEVLAVLAPLAINVALGQWTRSIETRAGVANAAPSPTGGLVNNAAITA